jgi:hypothetical protein
LPAENRAYYKSISVVPGETLKAAFERASKIPLELPDEDSPEVEGKRLAIPTCSSVEVFGELGDDSKPIF